MNANLRLLTVILARSFVALSPADAARKPGKSKAADRKIETSPAWVWPKPRTPPGTQFKTFKSAVLSGQEVSYLFWTPPGYDAADTTKRYPVAYFLHGGGGNYTHIPEAFLPWAEQAIRNGELPPFLGIVVNGLPSSFAVDSKDGRNPVESVVIKDVRHSYQLLAADLTVMKCHLPNAGVVSCTPCRADMLNAKA